MRKYVAAQSGPGRDLIFKVTGEDTAGALDYFIVEVAPHGGPPLHVHHRQEETIHVLTGRFKVRIGDELFELDTPTWRFALASKPRVLRARGARDAAHAERGSSRPPRHDSIAPRGIMEACAVPC